MGSGEVPSPRQTSIDKTDERVMNSERVHPPPRRSVHHTADDMYRAPARRLTQKYWGAGV